MPESADLYRKTNRWLHLSHRWSNHLLQISQDELAIGGLHGTGRNSSGLASKFCGDGEHLCFPQQFAREEAIDFAFLFFWCSQMARRLFSFAAFWLVALFPIWSAAQNNASSANLPEQYQLCEKELEIQILQNTHGLVRVDATPTHAALEPGWPEVLATLTINLGIFLWSRFTEHGVYLNRFVSFLLPVGITALWFATFVVAQLKFTSAGWISASLTTTLALLATIVDWLVAVFVWGDSRRTQPFASGWVPVIIGTIGFIGTLEVACVFAAVVQRFVTSTEYGAVAYDINDSHGCIPRGGDANFPFLQQGVRSRIFSVIQLAQAVYSLAACFALVPFALRKGKRMVKEMMLDTGLSNPNAFGAWMNHLVAARGFARFMQTYLPVATLVSGAPMLLYGAIIATRGVPVAISGNCMLVELSPRFGFLDSEVDLWWRVLAGAVGH
ncbi:hypothetical protein B0T16DRAFT_410635 [Cercophora newfieldiana]|uniref:Uncharacterized protein n=1 Tax=Cercophora newfieldiana TaxID=92897 RepID=A0AA39YBT3_9PEZI|nr:hypothetical protein B0T16DRAFT_410635 [Cercophora newfieldiana]